MTRMRIVLVALAVCGVLVGGFLAGRASAQQVTPPEVMTPYQFPRTWGDFRTAVAAPSGEVYFFESADGVIRKVRVADGVGIVEIHVTQRSGAGPRGNPGTLR